ncbi:oxidoreductase [Apiospora saccharicola]|uniref:Oxidoreductase n=1 Tax=Apiospora saccharicola TaxID=335842 RepID=A0ABR1TIZ5_9PEZI
MRVFVTGSTGFVGTAVVTELLSAGHTVVGLTRSDAGVAQLENLRSKGAAVEPLRGTLDDLDLLRRTAAASDAVLHLAYNHDDFSRYAEACAADRAAIGALASALGGTAKPLVITSATTGLLSPDGPDAPGTEADTADPSHPWSALRSQSEQLVRALAAHPDPTQSVRAMIVRLPPTAHGPGSSGFMSVLVGAALRHGGQAAYVGDGRNAWSACHRDDAARLYRLIMEKGRAGAAYHAVGEEAVPVRDLAEAIGARLGRPAISIQPDQVKAHYGWFGFAGANQTASSAKTREELAWNPTGPTVVEDTPIIVDFIKAHGSIL